LQTTELINGTWIQTYLRSWIYVRQNISWKLWWRKFPWLWYYFPFPTLNTTFEYLLKLFFLFFFKQSRLRNMLLIFLKFLKSIDLRFQGSYCFRFFFDFFFEFGNLLFFILWKSLRTFTFMHHLYLLNSFRSNFIEIMSQFFCIFLNFWRFDFLIFQQMFINIHLLSDIDSLLCEVFIIFKDIFILCVKF